MLNGDLTVAPPSLYEFGMVGRAPELSGGREAPDGIGTEL
jgi:hypothetical protein